MVTGQKEEDAEASSLMLYDGHAVSFFISYPDF